MSFQVSCMQFVNIVVHSVEDMNFRVHLQHEFTLLGLDHFLEVCYFIRFTALYLVTSFILSLLDVQHHKTTREYKALGVVGRWHLDSNT